MKRKDNYKNTILTNASLINLYIERCNLERARQTHVWFNGLVDGFNLAFPDECQIIRGEIAEFTTEIIFDGKVAQVYDYDEEKKIFVKTYEG